MHVPDGFIDAPVSVAAGAVAAGAVAVSLRGARHELAERTAPLAGLVAAFVFAVQMLNFPVAAGTSGHLLGGALAAILVGPWTAVLCIAVVLLMQGLLFADGGLTALGVNITLMGVVTVAVSYAVFRALFGVLPRGRGGLGGLGVATFVAAALSVPASALAFTGLYALGGTADVSLTKVATAMVGVHLLIGLGEAAITTATVASVAAVRPDLIHGAQGVRRPLELRTATVARPGDGATAPLPERTGTVPAGAGTVPAGGGTVQGAAGPRPGRSPGRVWAVGVAASLVLAGVVSFYASSDPDGLEKVAGDKGIAEEEKEHALSDSPLADYGVEDITDARLSGGLAGVIGVTVTLAVGSGVFVAVRRRRGGAAPLSAAAGAGGGEGPGEGRGEGRADKDPGRVPAAGPATAAEEPGSPDRGGAVPGPRETDPRPPARPEG
ncbi:energy-coupling factor ABC transporter permease [Streptomyces sp. WMMC500]|uniref:energy-coupling factor ABC transporter permease n=1 Tax=Streptomyces sp. WMMC500 TaxID=3015154 RepID=UPI00248AC9C3|nr:energy-coupling factor ABC transporter permease [Streptomyces sp. WMMC500]WBB58835.1 energy-coupling factor ABC transporter permease [Streptomyces sp. WMMC500]